ncbi:uncharacterized protein LOC117788018 [Drosophila innubila]|uniref:uncharacterized protein LOC117788018 n=1 Tax=Drosophila innubila TaxID=198719 RepID=UPI00148B4247|nr:uncharacterized protein LOC117788018 [Drosophila innubila]
MAAVKKVNEVPLRRSQRLRKMRETKKAVAAAPRGVLKRGPPLRLIRGRARTQRLLEQGSDRSTTRMRRAVVNPNRGLYTAPYISPVVSNNTNNNDEDEDEDDEQTMHLTAFLMYVALIESPSLAQLMRRNPSEGIRKLFRIIRFLFSRN